MRDIRGLKSVGAEFPSLVRLLSIEQEIRALKVVAYLMDFLSPMTPTGIVARSIREVAGVGVETGATSG